MAQPPLKGAQITPQAAQSPSKVVQTPPKGAQSPSKVAQAPPKRFRHPLRWLTHPTGGLRSPIRQLSPPPKWPRYPQRVSDTPSGGSDTPQGGSISPSHASDPPSGYPHPFSSPSFFPLERMRGKSPQQWAPNIEAAPRGAAQVHFGAPCFLQRSLLAFPTWCGPGAPQRSRAAMLQAGLHLVRPPGITPNHYTTTWGFNSNTTVIP